MINQFLLLVSVYVLGAILCQLLVRVLEVVSVIERHVRWDTHVSGYTLRTAWGLENGYDTYAYAWLVCTAGWPIGIFTIPFIYFSEFLYIFGYPFRKLNDLNLIPYWLTFDALADRVNKGKK